MKFTVDKIDQKTVPPSLPPVATPAPPNPKAKTVKMAASSNKKSPPNPLKGGNLFNLIQISTILGASLRSLLTFPAIPSSLRSNGAGTPLARPRGPGLNKLRCIQPFKTALSKKPKIRFFYFFHMLSLQSPRLLKNFSYMRNIKFKSEI